MKKLDKKQIVIGIVLISLFTYLVNYIVFFSINYPTRFAYGNVDNLITPYWAYILPIIILIIIFLLYILAIILFLKKISYRLIFYPICLIAILIFVNIAIQSLGRIHQYNGQLAMYQGQNIPDDMSTLLIKSLKANINRQTATVVFSIFCSISFLALLVTNKLLNNNKVTKQPSIDTTNNETA